jgi:hypothetical protein
MSPKRGFDTVTDMTRTLVQFWTSSLFLAFFAPTESSHFVLCPIESAGHGLTVVPVPSFMYHTLVQEARCCLHTGSCDRDR